MSVIPLTIFFSLLLAGIFVLLFIRDQRRRPFSSPERDSLLPLTEETPRSVEPPVRSAESEHVDDHYHEHDHGGGSCGCRTGLRPPCVGCLKRPDQPATI